MRCWRRDPRSRAEPDDVLVIFADTPLIRPQTLTRMREALAQGAALVVLGFRPADPTGYGRLVMEGGELLAIREELDARPAERAIDSVQWRPDGVRGRVRARYPRTDRQ